MSSTKKALKNGVWNAAEVSIYPFLQLLLMPVFLSHLGTIQFGFWMLANSIVGSFSLFYTGIVDASIWQVSNAVTSTKDVNEKIAQSLSTTLYISLFAILTCVVLGVFLQFGISNYHWFGVNQEVLAFNPFTILALTLFSSLKILEQSFFAVFKGLENYQTSSMFGLSAKMMILMVNLLLAIYGFSLDYFFFSASVITLISALSAWRLLWKRYAIRISFEKAKMKLAENVKFAKWSWLQSVFLILSNQIDKLIVSTYGGLEVLSFYSIGFMVFSQLHNLFAAFGAWLFPFSARLKENLQAFKTFKNNGLIFSVVLSMLMLTALSVLEKPLFGMWLGSEKLEAAGLYIHYFIAFESILMLTIIPYYLLNGSGFIKQNAIMEICFKTLNVVAYTILFYIFGTVGLMLGLIISATLYVPFQHYASNSLLIKTLFDWNSLLSFFFLFASVTVYLLAFTYFQMVLLTISVAYLLINRDKLTTTFSSIKLRKA